MDVVALGLAKADAAKKYGPPLDRLEHDRWVPLGYRARPPFNSTGNFPATQQSNGINVGTTFRMIEEAQLSGRDVVAEFALFLNNGGVEAESGYDVTINRAVLATAVGTNLPFTFNGDTTVTVKGSKFGVFKVRSDPLGVVLNKGDVFYILVNVSVASGAKYPVTTLGRRGSYDEGAATGGVTTAGPGPDYTASGVGWTAEAGVIRMFMPSAILTRPVNPVGVPLFVGDSISVGTGESSAPVNAHWEEGWCTRAVRNRWPHYVVGFSGTALTHWNNSNQANSFRRKSVIAGVHFTDAVCELGINDIIGGASTATTQSRWLSVWRDLARYGRPVHQTTLTPPSTTSTDNWTTAAGQTANAVAPTVAACNAWLRDGAPIDPTTGVAVAVGTSNALRAGAYRTSAAGVLSKTTFTSAVGHPLTSVLEVGDAVATTRDSGIWKALPGGRVVADGAITTGTATLTSATAAFTAADVGRTVVVAGAGAAGAILSTSISAYTSATQVTLAANASTTVSGASTRISAFGTTIDGVHPSGTAGPDAGGHELIAAFVLPQLADILGTQSV